MYLKYNILNIYVLICFYNLDTDECIDITLVFVYFFNLRVIFGRNYILLVLWGMKCKHFTVLF